MLEQHSFQEVIEQFDRMCWHYRRKHECQTCPMYGGKISQCQKIAFNRPKETEGIVMSWAEEHPLVYPTWAEWLISIGAFDSPTHEEKEFSSVEVLYKMRDKMFKPIPADIAQKLRLQPKK